MDAKEIIRVLGGQTNICVKLGLKKSAVSWWIRRGIPAKHWPSLARLAAEYGYAKITVETLENHKRGRGE